MGLGFHSSTGFALPKGDDRLQSGQPLEQVDQDQLRDLIQTAIG